MSRQRRIERAGRNCSGNANWVVPSSFSRALHSRVREESRPRHWTIAYIREDAFRPSWSQRNCLAWPDNNNNNIDNNHNNNSSSNRNNSSNTKNHNSSNHSNNSRATTTTIAAATTITTVAITTTTAETTTSIMIITITINLVPLVADRPFKIGLLFNEDHFSWK